MMNKEAQIKELDEIITMTAFVQAHELDGDKDLSTIVAKAIYDKGYRKADGLIAENERLLTEIKEIENVRDAERDTACEKIALGSCKACDCYCGDDGCLEGNEYGDCQYANDIAYSVYDELYGE